MGERKPNRIEHIALVVTTLLALLQIPLTIKYLSPDKPKPQILGAQEAIIFKGGRDFMLRLFVNNAGSKDCSVTKVSLVWPDGKNASISEYKLTLPQTIQAGTTKLLKISGDTYELIGGGKWEDKIDTKLDTIEAEVGVTFNTNQIVKKTIIFTIEH